MDKTIKMEIFVLAAALACAGSAVWGQGPEPKQSQKPPVSAAHKKKPVTRPNKAAIEWVTIPGGKFTMGSGNGAEGPAHSVTIKSFQMAKTLVTNKQYRACVQAKACTAAEDEGDGFKGSEQPVVGVDWGQAQAFAKWAGGRLPTEAEWEYAARGAGKDRKYPWGDEAATCERAVITGCGDATAPVCSKPKGNTAQGLCDMAGNAWEWVQDWYHDSYAGAPSDGSAWEDPAGPDRVLRGGSWSRDASFARSASREFAPGELSLGLRPVRAVPAAPAPAARQPVVRLVGQAGIEWVKISSGTFAMGSFNGDEKPAHRVVIKPFELAKTLVTNKQYQACVRAKACTPPEPAGALFQGDDQPVVGVDWDQAKAFSEWVGGRLPSEAEWEYAARSEGKDWKYPWGGGDEDADCERTLIFGCGSATAPVCSKPKGNTKQGLCDMAGNAWEWVQDWYHGSYNGAPADGSAWESPAGARRAYRGGSWYGIADFARTTRRGSFDPGRRANYVGFRPAR